eukprot:467837_1
MTMVEASTVEASQIILNRNRTRTQIPQATQIIALIRMIVTLHTTIFLPIPMICMIVVSECHLFSMYSLKAASKYATSSPSTNVAIKCDLCDKYIYKYLLPLHYASHQQTKPHDVSEQEMEQCYAVLESTKCKGNSRKNLTRLVSHTAKKKVSKTKQKASKKYSVKSKKRSYSAMNENMDIADECVDKTTNQAKRQRRTKKKQKKNKNKNKNKNK